MRGEYSLVKPLLHSFRRRNNREGIPTLRATTKRAFSYDYPTNSGAEKQKPGKPGFSVSPLLDGGEMRSTTSFCSTSCRLVGQTDAKQG
ncbi:hypothetical protein G3O01_40950 [Burkholderia sp. Ac-20365]|jgi:hypothetical protein|nr:hypothetical protein [Burkholderia sp. Ac-20365]